MRLSAPLRLAHLFTPHTLTNRSRQHYSACALRPGTRSSRVCAVRATPTLVFAFVLARHASIRASVSADRILLIALVTVHAPRLCASIYVAHLHRARCAVRKSASDTVLLLCVNKKTLIYVQLQPASQYQPLGTGNMYTLSQSTHAQRCASSAKEQKVPPKKL